MKYKYFVSDSFDPYYNLALEDYLYSFAEPDEAILFLWQNADTIVIGRNQILENECSPEVFTASGGKLARRMSGGGAVYHDLGNQNYSLICKEKDKTQVVFHEVVCGALRLLGIDTEFNGRNDILVRNKKFSGNAFYGNGDIYCQHGTILVNSNIDVMNSVLTPGIDKLEKNGVKSISSRVINLSEVNSNITVDNIRQSLITFTRSVQIQFAISACDLEKRKQFFSDMNWIYNGRL